MEQSIVSDTGPLISLEKLPDGFDFIRLLYTEIIVPPSVLEELANGYHISPAAYLNKYRITDFVKVQQTTILPIFSKHYELAQAEKETITLAFTLHESLLIEETAGRAVAKELGVTYSGVASQIIKAHRKRLISKTNAFSKLRTLYATGRINKKILSALSEAISIVHN